ncbi:uncharacterized protein LOC109608757 isoform X2 [Aethina tumida]|uniref:uncharacterized protein LOC109608757 isoform X2 n=1 Tax=Aethina tumida TaxID=116153 RepID=UPI00096ADA16|nr:uncharacterized protein LOC109608757 isoform X2 [Aethina tumida]
MDSMRLSTVIVVICAVSALCYPSKPLNERSPELAWQAWLLVDDQNQNGKQQNDDGGQTMRRRITPKSVFIAPTFSPESLPPCADGYASDPMGRCMKIFKVDEDAHLQFLLQKITDKFGNTYSNDYDYEDEDEATSTPGPFQLNIPLGGLETAASDESKVVAGDDDEMDMAIVVAPTNSNFNPQEAISKLDKQRRGGIQQTTDSQTQMPEKPEDKQEVNTEASFIDEIQTTTETTTTEIESTTSSTTMETTTDFTTVTPTTESTTSTTEIDLETTTITNLELEETRTELMDDYTSTTTESTTTTDLPIAIHNYLTHPRA